VIDGFTTKSLAASSESGLIVPGDLTSRETVSQFLSKLIPTTRDKNPTAALVPWICERLPSEQSRKTYASVIRDFVLHMNDCGLDPLSVRGDDVRIFREALRQAGMQPATIAKHLSVLRGMYRQFGKRGLIDWGTVQDIQAVQSPRVERNATPILTETEAKKLLHQPDQTTIAGIRDHAMLFVFFKTACRVSAIANAKIGSLERSDLDFYLVIQEKGGKRQRKALLESSRSLLRYLEIGCIMAEPGGTPLFRPVAKDRKTLLNKHLSRRSILDRIKRHAINAGIDVSRFGNRDICCHSLRGTSITNAIQHGAKLEQAQALAGHSDIRTTRGYFHETGREAEEAARHIQIR
jgi:integrase/recombinase XerC/integrase/recombinase XerD